MFGNGESFHLRNRVAWHGISGLKSRCIRINRLFVDFAVAVVGGLTFRAYTAADLQCNADAARVLCLKHFNTMHWDAVGCQALIFLDALLSGPWIASDMFTREEAAVTIFTGYYLLLSLVQVLWDEFGAAEWDTYFLPRMTVINLLFNCGHMINRIAHWPADVPYRPSRTLEIAQEHHFGRVKSTYNGTPGVKDAIYGTQRVHLKQFVDLQHEEDCPTINDFSAPMGEDDLVAASKVGLYNACHLSSWLNLGVTAHRTAINLDTWFGKFGRSFLHSAKEAPTHAESDDLEEIYGEEVDVAPEQLGENPGEEITKEIKNHFKLAEDRISEESRIDLLEAAASKFGNETSEPCDHMCLSAISEPCEVQASKAVAADTAVVAADTAVVEAVSLPMVLQADKRKPAYTPSDVVADFLAQMPPVCTSGEEDNEDNLL